VSDDPTIIAEWPLNSREHLRVSIEKFNGFDLINIRKWFKAEDGELRPGRHGIAVQVKHLPHLAAALTKALALATERDLIRTAPAETP
jgi:hypothetical protein